MFLSAHTIKGGAAMVGLGRVQALSHAMEDVLVSLRDRKMTLDSGTADTLLRAVDALHLMIQSGEPTTDAAERDVDDLIAALSAGLVKDSSPPPPNPTPSLAPIAAPARALLVEESATVRVMEEMMLADAGLVVEAVAESTQALTLLRLSAYDLLVVGAQTFTLAGTELVAAIRRSRRGRNCPIVVLGTEDQPAARQGALELGATHYLTRGSMSQQALSDLARTVVTEEPR
jgi:chemotaxis protein histidine kinase CheA